MLNQNEKTILIANLPEDWKKTAAAEFSKSTSYVEKVAYGTKVDITVFEFLVELAEATKNTQETKMAELKSRIQKLATPISA